MANVVCLRTFLWECFCVQAFSSNHCTALPDVDYSDNFDFLCFSCNSFPYSPRNIANLLAYARALGECALSNAKISAQSFMSGIKRLTNASTGLFGGARGSVCTPSTTALPFFLFSIAFNVLWSSVNASENTERSCREISLRQERVRDRYTRSFDYIGICTK